MMVMMMIVAIMEVMIMPAPDMANFTASLKSRKVQGMEFKTNLEGFLKKNTIKAGGSTARAQNVDWVSGVDGWMDTP